MLAYKYRIYSTEADKILLEKHFGCYRFLYNHFLTYRKNEYDNILRRGLDALGIPLSQIKEIKLSNVKSKSFELGISLLDSKQLAFRVSGR